MNFPNDMAGSVQRGLVLKEQRRYGEAIKYFHEALAQNPNDAFALAQVAACQLQLPGGEKEALQSIDRALAIEPNNAGHHGMRAWILCALKHPADGLKSAREGIALAPYSSFAFTTEAQALLHLERWSEAEEAARRALALDADDATAANQLAQALRLQNKMAENAGQIAGMLERDPANAQTHCSAGWAALQRGSHREAEKHFLEALRLNPGSENARQGLLNSFRARSPLYRGYLAYSFWMQRLNRKARWGIVLGLYFGSRFARQIFTGPLAPLGISIGVLYILFVLWVWIARGVGNFILMFDRFAKHALRRNEKTEACFVGGGLCTGVLMLAVALGFHRSEFLLPSVALIAIVFPFSMTFTNASRLGAILFGIIGSACIIACIVLLLSAFTNIVPADVAMTLFTIAVAGAVLSTWLGNVRALRI